MEKILQNNKKVYNSKWSKVPIFLGAIFLTLIFVEKLDSFLFLNFNQWSRFFKPYLWANLTILGDSLVISILILPLIYRRKDLIWPLLLAAVISILFTHGLKNLLNVPRPPAVFSQDSISIIGPIYRHKSFPSGHAATIFTIFSLLILSAKNEKQKWILLTISLIIGISRVAVGVHWLSDIIGGFLIGWFSSIGGLLLYDLFNKKLPDVKFNIIGPIIIIAATYLVFFYYTRYEHTTLLKTIIGIYAITNVLATYVIRYLQNFALNQNQKIMQMKAIKILLAMDRTLTL